MTDDIREEVTARVDRLLAEHHPAESSRLEFLRARFDAGLAWVHFPEKLGGLGLPRAVQPYVDQLLRNAGAPDNAPGHNPIGLGMAAPTILTFGTAGQQHRHLRPLWTGEEIWCQLFSEPGAGSDLAGVATRAVRDGEDWVADGQKVWTSLAHKARWAILLARTDPDVPKHVGLTYFICDMTDPGIEVRPLRQITGEAEFNEVFLTRVRIRDTQRLGDQGQGWHVATATLMNERVSIGGLETHREGGMVGAVATTWRLNPHRHTPSLHGRLMRLWVAAETARLTNMRLQQKLVAGQPGPEGSGLKLASAHLAQELSALEMEILGDEALRYEDWTMRRPDRADLTGRDAAYRYLRAKGNSIEGGTSEVLRNIVAERVLKLPPEQRADKDLAWKDLSRE